MKIEKLFAFPASELVLKETLFTAKEPSSSIASFKCCVATTKDHGVIMGSSWGPSLHLRAVGVIAKRVKKGIVACGRNAAVRKDPGNFIDFHIIVLVYKENAATAFPNYICLQTNMRSAWM